MSAKATGIVWESDLPRPKKYVLLALADHAKEDGTDVYPSLARIQWKTGYSETQIRDLIGELVEDRILILVRKGGNGAEDTNRYRIDLKALRQLPDFKEWNAQKQKKDKDKGAKTVPLKNAKGAEIVPIEGAKTEPLKGAVSGPEGCGFAQNKGAKTEPEPRTNRTVILEGNSASELPGFSQSASQNGSQSLPGIEPPAQEPKKQPQDQRFPEICDAIRKCWPKGDGYKCDITPADAGAINRALAKFHDWSAEELSICIVARFQSGSVNPAESVKAWIGAITDYQSGPQNKFKLPQFEGSALDRWREQARVILYGPQPVQQRLGAQQKQPESDWKRMQREYREQMNS